MVKRTQHLFLIFILLIVALACVTPAVTTPDPNFINTAIAQTQTAALGIPITGQESLTPTLTRAPSATPFPTFTAVVIGVPQVSVYVDTNCRTGPGEIYDRVGVLRVGAVVDVVGRSADGNYWVIRNPDGTGETCWISGQNATLTGLTTIVPVFAIPPTPTPTNTRVASFTPTHTRTPVRTFTPTWTPTRPAPSFTPTSTFTSPPPTATPTMTPTLSSTSTPTSFTATTSPTMTGTLSPTPTSTLTTSTLTASPTVTPTLSLTSTPSPTPTPTSTLTTSTVTASPTATPTLSATSTSSPTPTSTPSSTPTSTASPTSTPLAGFTASYSGLESCTGTGWWVDLELKNTGGMSFESMSGLLIDTIIGTVVPFNSEDFTNRDGCSTSSTQANLPPGSTRIVSLPVFMYDPTGHPLRATVVVCSGAGRSGICMAQSINFTP